MYLHCIFNVFRHSSGQDEIHEKLQIPSSTSSSSGNKKQAVSKKANVSMVHSVPELKVTDKVCC